MRMVFISLGFFCSCFFDKRTLWTLYEVYKLFQYFDSVYSRFFLMQYLFTQMTYISFRHLRSESNVPVSVKIRFNWICTQLIQLKGIFTCYAVDPFWLKPFRWNILINNIIVDYHC